MIVKREIDPEDFQFWGRGQGENGRRHRGAASVGLRSA